MASHVHFSGDVSDNLNNNNSKMSTSEQFTFGRGMTVKSAAQNLLGYAHNGVNTNKLVNKRNPNSYTDFDMLARGVSVYLFNWMREDLHKFNSSTDLSNTKYNIPPIESEKYIKFTCDIITITDTVIVDDQFIGVNAIPSIQDIYKYLDYFKATLKFIPPNLILTCIYLKRICETANILLHKSNYRLLFTVSLIIAQKIWMEPYKQTKEFAVLFPDNYNKDQLRLWERDLLSIIYNDTKIEPSIYGNMYGNLKNNSKRVTVAEFVNNSSNIGYQASERSGAVPIVDNEINYNSSTTSLINPNILNPQQSRMLSIDKMDIESNDNIPINHNKVDKSSIETETVIYKLNSNTTISDTVSIRTDDLMISNVNIPSKPNLLDLYSKGVTHDQLKALGYTIYDFIDVGFQILDLMFAKFSLKELLNVKRDARQPNGVIVKSSYFSVFDLREQGRFTITDFLNEGFSLSDFKSSGFVEFNFRNCGVSIRDLVEAGYSNQDLLNLHFTPIQIMEYELDQSLTYKYNPSRFNICNRYSEDDILSVSSSPSVKYMHQNIHSLNTVGSQTINAPEGMIKNERNDSEILKIPYESAQSKYKKVRSLYFSSDNLPTIHNIANPDVGEIMFCISALIQAQIFQDLKIASRKEGEVFDLIPILLPEFGGEITIIPKNILLQESANYPALRAELLKFSVPTIDTILKYLALIRSRAHYTSECNIIALILLNRITSVSTFPLKKTNWRSLWLICIIIAQKMWDDTPLNTPDFSCIVPDFTPEILFNWEMEVLQIIEWRTVINPSTYCLYYFELRQLLFEIIGPRTTTSIDVKYKPVSRECLFKLIEGSNTRGISNYSRIDGMNKIDSLRNSFSENIYKSENAYRADGDIESDLTNLYMSINIKESTFVIKMAQYDWIDNDIIVNPDLSISTIEDINSYFINMNKNL